MARYLPLIGLGISCFSLSGYGIVKVLQRSTSINAKAFSVRGKAYQGPFEIQMTRKEAALILGVK